MSRQSMQIVSRNLRLNGFLRRMVAQVRREESEIPVEPKVEKRKGPAPTVGTDEQVLICRALFDLCDWPPIRIAKAVGLTRDEVKYIVAFKTRTHLIPKKNTYRNTPMKYKDNIWHAMSHEHDKIHLKTRKVVRERLLKLFKLWRLAQ